MKDYYERGYKAIKSRSYLIWGLVMASLALIMFVLSMLTIVHGNDIFLMIIDLAAAVMWAVAAGICLNVYYKDNHVELRAKAKEIAESVAESVESVKSVESFLKK